MKTKQKNRVQNTDKQGVKSGIETGSNLGQSLVINSQKIMIGILKNQVLGRDLKIQFLEEQIEMFRKSHLQDQKYFERYEADLLAFEALPTNYQAKHLN